MPTKFTDEDGNEYEGENISRITWELTPVKKPKLEIDWSVWEIKDPIKCPTCPALNGKTADATYFKMPIYLACNCILRGQNYVLDMERNILLVSRECLDNLMETCNGHSQKTPQT